MPPRLTELNGSRFDVIVIGGGINGASTAQHLAAAGYSTLIVDKGDFGFAEFPYQAKAFDRSGFEAEEFCRVPYLLGVPRGHRLATRKIARPADLAGERFISLTTNTVGRLLVDQLFEREGVARDMVVDCQVMAVVANLISQGVGIGFLDPFTAADYAGRNIVPVRFEPAVEMRIGMLHPTHRPLTRIASEFAALLRSSKRKVLANFASSAKSV